MAGLERKCDIPGNSNTRTHGHGFMENIVSAFVILNLQCVCAWVTSHSQIGSSEKSYTLDGAVRRKPLNLEKLICVRQQLDQHLANEFTNWDYDYSVPIRCLSESLKMCSLTDECLLMDFLDKIFNMLEYRNIKLLMCVGI